MRIVQYSTSYCLSPTVQAVAYIDSLSTIQAPGYHPMSTFQAAGEENLGEQRFAGKSQSLTSFHGSSFFSYRSFSTSFCGSSFPTSFHGSSFILVVAFPLVFMVVAFPLVFMVVDFSTNFQGST